MRVNLIFRVSLNVALCVDIRDVIRLSGLGLTEGLAMMSLVIIVSCKINNHRIPYWVLVVQADLEVIGVERLYHNGVYYRVVAFKHLRRVAHLNLLLGVDWEFHRGCKLSNFNVLH